MQKLTYIESQKKYISINYHLYKWCNFKCSYCSDKNNRDGKWQSSKNDLEDFWIFIKKLDAISSDTNIEITLIWWEPLLNNNIFFLIDNLYLINSKNNNIIKIIIATNWFLITKFSENIIKYNWNDFLSINFSYHYHELKKYDLNHKIFLKTLDFLLQNKIHFNIKFLLPTKKDEFLDLKKLIDNIYKLPDFSTENITLDLIVYWWKIDDYDEEIILYYNSFYSKNNNIKNDKYLDVIVDNQKENLSNQEVFIRWLNEYKWFKCYPFWHKTFLNVSHDLIANFVWCKTLMKNYSLEEILSIFSDNKSEDKFVNCTDDICECCSAYGIKKYYDNKCKNYNDYLNQKLKQYFILPDIELIKIDYLNNNLDLNKFEIIFKYIDYNIIFVVDCIDKNNKYIYENWIVWLYRYAKNSKSEIDIWFEANDYIIEKITIIIKKLLPIFQTIILKWKKQ